MSKIFNKYANDMDKTWYESSNILYSECDDITDNLKVLRIIFKNGRVYQYTDVDVIDYLLFRDDVSQGKAFNLHIKKYKCERLDDVDVNVVNQEMQDELKAQQEIEDKEDLIIKLYNISADVELIKNSLNSITLTNNDLACVMSALNKISQTLNITEFSGNDVDLIKVNEIWNLNRNELDEQVKNNQISSNEADLCVIKQLLKNE